MEPDSAPVGSFPSWKASLPLPWTATPHEPEEEKPGQLITSCPEEVTPVPVRLTVAVGLVDELLAMVRVPVAAPAVVGSNSTLTVAVGLEVFRVSGKVAPEKEKPVPAMATELTVTGAPPVEVRVTDCVAGVFRVTSPKAMLVELTLSMAT
jgi:hypothetical protein